MSQNRRRGPSLRALLTNLDAPLPLPKKLFYLTRNLTKRAVTLSTCCGHPGQPGC
jgi:hypothetical protein